MDEYLNVVTSMNLEARYSVLLENNDSNILTL